jgi:hypothetical protein
MLHQNLIQCWFLGMLLLDFNHLYILFINKFNIYYVIKFYRAVRHLLKKDIQTTTELCEALNLPSSSSPSAKENLKSKLSAYPSIFVQDSNYTFLEPEPVVVLNSLLPLASNVTVFLPSERY